MGCMDMAESIVMSPRSKLHWVMVFCRE